MNIFSKNESTFIKIDKKYALRVGLIYINFPHYCLIDYTNRMEDEKLQLTCLGKGIWVLVRKYLSPTIGIKMLLSCKRV